MYEVIRPKDNKGMSSYFSLKINKGTDKPNTFLEDLIGWGLFVGGGTGIVYLLSLIGLIKV